MRNKLNRIIDSYRKNSELYSVLNINYADYEITEAEYNERLEAIKRTVVNYYLYKYSFSTVETKEIQNDLLTSMIRYCNLHRCTRIIDGKLKIYPTKLSNEELEKHYCDIVKSMVDNQIEIGADIESLIDGVEKKLKIELDKYKTELKKLDMLPYYGSPYYMIERAKYVMECIKHIPNVFIDASDIIIPMLAFEEKYIKNLEGSEKTQKFPTDDETFYHDYDLLEECYQKILSLEDELSKPVAAAWQAYLTDPREHTDDFRYVIHAFSGEYVDPEQMKKACCSLSTSDIVNKMYGEAGLIYPITAESIGTMCTEDAGSWVTDRNRFIDRGCPGSWQITDVNGPTIWYENPYNSKLIMPEAFETEYQNTIASDETWDYSEILLNEKARPVGAFYTDDCQNYGEIEAYAQKHNLPLVNITSRVPVRR